MLRTQDRQSPTLWNIKEDEPELIKTVTAEWAALSASTALEDGTLRFSYYVGEQSANRQWEPFSFWG